jgi:hypothetical protein
MFMHTLDHVQAESESEVYKEQVQEVFEGPQVISCEKANISLFPEQASPGASNPILDVLLNFV